MMARTATKKPAAQTARAPKAPKPITLETVALIAPNATVASNIATRFALDPVDFAEIREMHEEMIGRSAQALLASSDETALKIHLQRIVGAFVSSAHGAATFYSAKVTTAKDLTAKLANENRDEDRDGIIGFETRAERARDYAARAGLRAFALLAAATGAADAYAQVIGEDWKPFTSSALPARSVSRQAAAAELDAFG